MFSSERHEIRNIMFEAWRKHIEKKPIEALEAQIIEVILLHPEYHVFLSQPERYQDKDFSDVNPFFHLGLHLALLEQINTNRPPGIKDIYKKLTQQFSDPHIATHKMMDCLAEVLWSAQQTDRPPNPFHYLEKLKNL